MVCLDHAVFGRHRGSLNQRQQVALHALAGDLGPAALATRGDLIDLIDEYDAVLLQHVQRLGLDLFFVDQLGSFFIDQQLQGFRDLELSCLAFLLAHLAEHATQLLGHFLHTRRPHDLQLRSRLCHIDLDFPVCQLAFPQLLAKSLACRTFRLTHLSGTEVTTRWRDQDVEHSLFRGVFSAGSHLFHLGHPGLLDRNVGQIPNDGVNILADIAHFSELGGLHLDKRRIGQTGQTPGDFGLADARGSNHQNVFGRDLGPQARLDMLTTPAVAQGNCHGPLGLLLTNDVFVEFDNNFLWSHGRHGFKGSRWCDSCWCKCTVPRQSPTTF